MEKEFVKKKDDDMHFEVMNKNFDISRGEISRVEKYYVFSKFLPFGNFGGGPGLKCLLIALFMHYFGWWITWLFVHFEKQVRLIHVTMKRIKYR